MGTLVPFNPATPHAASVGVLHRPFDSEGLLLAAHGSPQSRAALWLAAGERLAEQVAQVCCWRADQRNTAWQVGDYSFLVLECGAGATHFVQLWSEPDDGKVLFEVSAAAAGDGVPRHLARRRQEELRERGFETGGNAGNFVKEVCVGTPQAATALAREALGVLCRVLGYDGTVPLRYVLHLGTRLQTHAVHTGLNADDLVRLLRSWGFLAERHADPQAAAPSPVLLDCEYDDWHFNALLLRGASDVPGQHGLLCLRRFLVDKSYPMARIAQYVNTQLLAMQASIDAEGDLQLEQCIVLDGGITARNLRNQLLLWLGNLERIKSWVQGGCEGGGAG